MREQMNNSGRWNTKRQLLTGVSALALISLPVAVLAAEDDRPTIWFELGGQLEGVSNGQETFAPPFVAKLIENPFTPPAKIEAPPRYSNGEEGRVSFQPENSDWVFSAALRYGRANGNKNVHQATVHPSVHLIESIPYFGINHTAQIPATTDRFASTVSRQYDTHLIADFQAGKDVGLGSFGAYGTSRLSAGVRFAQFSTRSSSEIDSDPDFTITYKYATQLAGHPAYLKFPKQHWNLYKGKIDLARGTRGIGPSLAWDADAALLGHSSVEALTLDWGVNGALLFGRQKMRTHHETSAHYKSYRHASGALPLVYQTGNSTARSHSVLVPNVGGFAGMSLRFPNAKISIGYRADLFFGAMDGGIDKAKKEDMSFYGPFAAISVGIGG